MAKKEEKKDDFMKSTFSTESIQEETAIKVPKLTERAIDKVSGKFLLKPAKETWLKKQNPEHDGAVLFSKTFVSLSPQIQHPTGLVITGMTEQQAAELEEEMNLRKGTLSPYNKNYWADHRNYIRVPREGIVIDCDRSALDKMHYLIAKASQKVALSYQDLLDKPEAEFVLVSQEKEAEISNKKFETKNKAFKRYGEMSLSEQIDFLKVYEGGRYKVTKSNSPEFITSAIGRIVDEEPNKFLDLANDPNFKTMVFLYDCISIRAISKAGTQYYITGGDKIGNSFLQTIQNLQSPDYQEAVIGLKAKLESINK